VVVRKIVAKSRLLGNLNPCSEGSTKGLFRNRDGRFSQSPYCRKESAVTGWSGLLLAKFDGLAWVD
jgi:hypothetical protein